MMRVLSAFLSALTLSSLQALPSQAQTADEIAINIHASSGVQSHSAPVNGQLPILLEDAMISAGIQYTVTWFPSVPGYAVMILAGEPESTNGTFGSSFWWACINEVSSPAGLQTLVKAGDQVDWMWISDGTCPQDNSAH